MRINLSIKDLFHSSSKLKRQIISSGLMMGVFMFIAQLSNSTNLYDPRAELQIYNLTIFELFFQFNWFLMIVSGIATIIITIFICSDIINTKRRDLGIMKAVGAEPKILYSFYLYQLYILVLLAFVVGIIISSIFYLISIIILEQIGVQIFFYFNPLYPVALLFILFMCIFIFNGYELRKIGSGSYTNSQRLYEIKKFNKHDIGRISKFLEKKSISSKIALRQLRRNKQSFTKVLVVIAVITSILFTGVVGYYTLDGSSKNYIRESQNENIIAIGHADVIDVYTEGYKRFGDASITDSIFSSINNYKQEKYNISAEFVALLESDDKPIYLDNYEEKIITFHEVKEQTGLIVNAEGRYVEVGSNRTKTVPVIGINFNQTLSNWDIEGTLPNASSRAAVGDTLLSSLFNLSLAQGFNFYDLESNRSYYYKIDGIVIDSFNRGYVAFVPLEDLRVKLGIGKFSNLIIIKWVGDSCPIDELNLLVKEFCGDSFVAYDMNPIFDQNIRSISRIQIVPAFLVIVLVAIIFISINNSESARIREYLRDYEIMLATGASKNIIRNIIFKSVFLLFLIGSLFGLIASMYLILFAFIKNATLPNEILPFIVYGVTLVCYLIASFFNSSRITKDISKDSFTHFK